MEKTCTAGQNDGILERENQRKFHTSFSGMWRRQEVGVAIGRDVSRTHRERISCYLKGGTKRLSLRENEVFLFITLVKTQLKVRIIIFEWFPVVREFN